MKTCCKLLLNDFGFGGDNIFITCYVAYNILQLLKTLM